MKSVEVTRKRENSNTVEFYGLHETNLNVVVFLCSYRLVVL